MRYFFNIQDKLKIEDEVGREFDLASEAVVFAKQLAADIRCLAPRVTSNSSGCGQSNSSTPRGRT